MSIRIDKFNTEILPVWDVIKELINEIDSKGLSTSDRDQIAYLKKVKGYLSEMLAGAEPDFIPLQTLSNLKSSLSNIKGQLESYINNKNITHINNVTNDYIDTLLRDLMPFIFYKGTASKALQTALSEYSKTITEYSQSYLIEIQKIHTDVQNLKYKMDMILENVSDNQEQFNEYNIQLFDEDNGLKNRITEMVDDFEEKFNKIEKFYEIIFQEDGLEEKLKLFEQDAEEQNEEISQLKKDSENTLNGLKKFYVDIFGTKNDDGEITGGLKQELVIRKQQLEDFKIEQQTRYRELNTQIETLLPGATSAGLSSAYKDMRMGFETEAKWYGWAFYGSLFILLLVVVIIHLLIHYEIFSFIEIPVTDSDNLGTNLLALFKSLIFKLPFYLPALWLVIFISKRRNEVLRLEQEYAHKEALAKSYDSYRQQVEKLQQEQQNKLLPILLEKMIIAISLNPAETLDKGGKDKTPIEELMKKQEFLDFIKKAKDFSNGK